MQKKLLPGQSLAQVSNWADSIKSKPEWAHSKTWHYVDIADDQVSVTLEKSSDELSVLELNVTFPEEKR